MRGIDRGVLLLTAFWSGYSFNAFASITEVVSRMDARRALQLIVVDIDGSEMKEFRGKFTGQARPLGCETAQLSSRPVVA